MGQNPEWRECVGSVRSTPRTCTVFPRSLGGGVAGHAEWSVAKRRVPRGRRPDRRLSFWTEPIRREQPPRTCAAHLWRAPGPDMCPGGTAATDAQWGDRAFERQYRYRLGLR
jgi:hypothetical protein